MRNSYAIFECSSCGIVFFDREAFELHDYQTYYDYTDSWDATRVDWEIKIRKRSISRQLARIGSYVTGRRLLDVGAGPGFFCRVAVDNGWEAKALEVSEKAVRIGKQFSNIEYVQLDDVAEESMDVIICYHVLEHMAQPDNVIQSLHSRLKPGGVIAVHVPHREPLSFAIRNWLSSGKQAETERLCQLYVPEHISGFTKESLLNAFQIFGFDPLFIQTSAMWGTYYDPFFLRNYLREKNYAGLLKHALRSAVDNLGRAFGRGDWVVGHFRKA